MDLETPLGERYVEQAEWNLLERRCSVCGEPLVNSNHGLTSLGNNTIYATCKHPDYTHTTDG